MKRKIPDLQTRLNLLGAIILVVGLATAIWIYANAVDIPYGALGYEDEGGTLYPVMPEDSKQYQRSMELYGGKANVLADEFRRWFGGLWHGKSLAVIIAATAILISFGCFYAANHLPPRLASKAGNENYPDGKD